MGVDLVRGRYFTHHDNSDGPWVAIVDDEFVRRVWPTEDPIGKRISIHRDDDGNRVWREVVGVVRHSRHASVRTVGRVQSYYPELQGFGRTNYLAARTISDPISMATSLRDLVHGLDPEQPISELRPMTDLVNASVSQPRFNMLILVAYAGVALLLATVGVFGVVSYSVSLRNHELGVRMALGAARTDVLGLVLRDGLKIASIGLGIGLMGSVLLTQLLENMLFEVSSLDTVTYAAVTGVLCVVATVACLLPAFRASRVHPVEALRQE